MPPRIEPSGWPGMHPLNATIVRTGLEVLYFSGAHLLMRPFCAGVGSILMLHHVRPPSDDGFQPNRLLEVAPGFLEQTLAWLRREEIDIISLDEMQRRLAERDFGRRFVCITLDDGYRDNKVWAYPIFKRFQAPFAIYVPTSFPEGAAKLWWRALELALAGHDSISVRIGGAERQFACATIRRKDEVYRDLYWRMRAIGDESELHAIMDDLARRHDLDMRSVAGELCMTWDEVRELAADPLATIGAHTINHLMLGKASEEVAALLVDVGDAG